MISANAKWAVVTPLSAALLSLGSIGISAPAAAAAEDRPFAGFYVGGNAGVTWGDSTSDAALQSIGSPPVASPLIVVPPSDVAAINAVGHFDSKHHTGFTGGLEAGYNWVLAGGMMFGIETDLNIYDITGNHTSTVTGIPLPGGTARTYTLNQSVDTDFLWTLRPRIGYVTGDVLLFATAGLALTTTKYKANFVDSSTPGNSLTTDRSSNSKTGWTIGAGLAYAISPDMSLKGEYLFENFGHSEFHGTSANGFLGYGANVHLKSHLFRAGLDYHF